MGGRDGRSKGWMDEEREGTRDGSMDGRRKKQTKGNGHGSQ